MSARVCDMLSVRHECVADSRIGTAPLNTVCHTDQVCSLYKPQPSTQNLRSRQGFMQCLAPRHLQGIGGTLCLDRICYRAPRAPLCTLKCMQADATMLRCMTAEVSSKSLGNSDCIVTLLLIQVQLSQRKVQLGPADCLNQAG